VVSEVSSFITAKNGTNDRRKGRKGNGEKLMEKGREKMDCRVVA
jgi:hypothetical protein